MNSRERYFLGKGVDIGLAIGCITGGVNAVPKIEYPEVGTCGLFKYEPLSRVEVKYKKIQQQTSNYTSAILMRNMLKEILTEIGWDYTECIFNHPGDPSRIHYLALRFNIGNTTNYIGAKYSDNNPDRTNTIEYFCYLNDIKLYSSPVALDFEDMGTGNYTTGLGYSYVETAGTKFKMLNIRDTGNGNSFNVIEHIGNDVYYRYTVNGDSFYSPNGVMCNIINGTSCSHTSTGLICPIRLDSVDDSMKPISGVEQPYWSETIGGSDYGYLPWVSLILSPTASSGRARPVLVTDIFNLKKYMAFMPNYNTLAIIEEIVQ